MSPFKPVTIRARRGLVIVAIASFFALPVGAWVVSSSLTATEDRSVKSEDRSVESVQTARLAADLAKVAADLARQIQAQRIESIRRNCREQNKRHDRTIAALDLLISKAPPGRRARAKQGRKSTVFLLNAIVPHQNCRALVARSTSTP